MRSIGTLHAPAVEVVGVVDAAELVDPIAPGHHAAHVDLPDVVGRALLLVGAGKLVEHPRPALAALLEGLHHVLDLFGRGVVVAEGEVGKLLVDEGLDPS